MCQHCEMKKDAEAKVEAAKKRMPATLDYIYETLKVQGEIAEATEWLDRVERSKCECSHGIYYGRGYVENGVFKGFKGTCFRCGGKGFQTNGDRKRNWGYDQNRSYTA